jgi:hypothetical protein
MILRVITFFGLRNFALHRPLRSRSKQFLKLLFVELGRPGRGVAAGFVARRNEVKAAVLHAFERLLGQSGLRRVALVVGRIDEQQGGRDLPSPPRDRSRATIPTRR